MLKFLQSDSGARNLPKPLRVWGLGFRVSGLGFRDLTATVWPERSELFDCDAKLPAEPCLSPVIVGRLLHGA